MIDRPETEIMNKSSTPVSPSRSEPAQRVACSDCNLNSLCLPVGIDAADLAELDLIINRRRPIARGDHLFKSGDPFRSIYAIRSGSLKTYRMTEDGREQINGFFLPGELVGFDAIGYDEHRCAAQALETTSVCEIPFEQLEKLGERIPSLPQQLLRIMSRELHDDHLLLMLLGKRTADERLAAFLASLSQRFGARGYSSSEFNLSMSRIDIGNYLGLAVETVSRLFGRFQEQGILEVHNRLVRLIHPERLRTLAGVTANS